MFHNTNQRYRYEQKPDFNTMDEAPMGTPVGPRTEVG